MSFFHVFVQELYEGPSELLVKILTTEPGGTPAGTNNNNKITNNYYY